jgi:hypothetical protein
MNLFRWIRSVSDEAKHPGNGAREQVHPALPSPALQDPAYRREEYRTLREELARNQAFVFERPLVIVGAALTAGVAASTAGFELDKPTNVAWLALAVGFLSAALILMLVFNLFFTQDRMLTNSRIIAYIQLFHDEGQINCKGWEDALRRRRRWTKENPEYYYLTWRKYALLMNRQCWEASQYRNWLCEMWCVFWGLFRVTYEFLLKRRSHRYKEPDYYTMVYYYTKGSIGCVSIIGLTILSFLYIVAGNKWRNFTPDLKLMLESLMFGNVLVSVASLTFTHWWARPKKFQNSINFNRELWLLVFTKRDELAQRIREPWRLTFIVFAAQAIVLAVSVSISILLVMVTIAQANACANPSCALEFPVLAETFGSWISTVQLPPLREGIQEAVNLLPLWIAGLLDASMSLALGGLVAVLVTLYVYMLYVLERL